MEPTRKSAFPKCDPKLYEDCILALDVISSLVMTYAKKHNPRHSSIIMFHHLAYVELRINQVWRFINSRQRRSIRHFLCEFVSEVADDLNVVEAYRIYILRLVEMLEMMWSEHKYAYESLMARMTKITTHPYGIMFHTEHLVEDLLIEDITGDDQVDALE